MRAYGYPPGYIGTRQLGFRPARNQLIFSFAHVTLDKVASERRWVHTQIMLLHNHFLWLSFTRIVCSARKQKVAAPELIYLDRADEQIDDDENEEGEIVQLVVRHSSPHFV